MKMTFSLISTLLCLAACSQTTPPSSPPNPTLAHDTIVNMEMESAEPTDPTDANTSNYHENNQLDPIGAVVSLLDLPHHRTDENRQPENHLNQTEQENHKLRQQVEKLKNKIKQLEKSKKNTAPLPKKKPPRSQKITALAPVLQPSLDKTTPSVPHSDNAPEVPTLAEIAPATLMAKNDVYQQAQTLFQQKKHQQVINLLKSADSGGNGSLTARKKMYLLLLSHQKLNNCQSVINIGQRLAQQFSGSHESAEAQFMVGQCQWHIQQRDIAKDTWRQLIASQPHSAAAKRAKTALQQK